MPPMPTYRDFVDFMDAESVETTASCDSQEQDPALKTPKDEMVAELQEHYDDRAHVKIG